MTVYKREIVNYPMGSWIEYFTDEELANKAFDAADAIKQIYVHDAGSDETDDLELYLMMHHAASCKEYNFTAEQITSKCFGRDY